ncbi:MAG: Gfo/Idh/MocA family oxidoreductase [Verrucomicrobia bacterium]|nr:Gfo/Idh/MocA family oxidoreductase [Verrucomicrobiota bacterium]
MKPIHLGIVGLGSIAEYHLRAFGRLDGVTLAAVASREPERVARVVREYGVAQGCRDYDQMLTATPLDAVVICTPSDLHAPMAAQALRAGKHVLVEKPLAVDPQEVDALCRLAREQGRILMAAMTARFTPQYLEAFRETTRGAIGGIQQIVIRWLEKKTIGVNWEGKAVSVDPRTSTALYHHGAHMLDAALWLAHDEAREVYAIGAKRQALNDAVAVLVRTRKGVLVSSVHSFNSPIKIHDCVIVGDSGLMEIRGYETLTVNGQVKIEVPWRTGLEGGVYNQAAEFVAAIRESRPPIASGEEVRATMAALAEAYDQLAKQGAQ